MNSCAAALEELIVTRKLAASLESENAALHKRLDTSVRTEAVLKELNETRQSETEALRSALAAKNETIAAQHAALAKQDELIAELKKRKSSVWKRVGDILIGVAISSVLR